MSPPRFRLLTLLIAVAVAAVASGGAAYLKRRIDLDPGLWMLMTAQAGMIVKVALVTAGVLVIVYLGGKA